MKKLAQIVLATAIAAAALPAFAGVVGTLTLVRGTVMTSTGGEFVSATAHTPINSGQQLMIGQDSSASITFTNGAVTNFTVPGTYTVNLPAVVGGGTVGAAGGAGTVATAGIILGTAALAGLGVDQVGAGTVPPDHPVSR